MARIRTIKPEFWTDEKVVALSPLARLLFVGMWNFVDDEGRAPYSPTRLKMQILPADAADISELIGEIRRVSLIVIYEHEGKEYLQVCGFARHQKVDKRQTSKHPAPPKPTEARRNTAPDQGREGIKEGIKEGNGRAADAANSSNEEVTLFREGKKLLGENSGGLIRKLLTAKSGSIPLARAAIETAKTKENPREWIGGVIRGHDPPEQRNDPRL